QDLLRTLRWVVVDEIHALAGNKRGADLALSLERIAGFTEDAVQRIGLSATCSSVQNVAQFLAGVRRPCTIAPVPDHSSMLAAVESLPADKYDLGFMARLVTRLEGELAANRTTLVFTNARGMAERLTWALKRRFPEKAECIAVHHSSVAAQGRRLIERRLKSGELAVVVTSTSLELGIDIGKVDGVGLGHPAGGLGR